MAVIIGLMNEERFEILKKIKNEPYKIAQAVGFSDVKEYPHNEWMKSVISGTGDYTLLSHRGSYKSSCLSVDIALMMILYIDENIIFLRKADNDVAEMIKMVRKALESDVLQSLSIVLHGKRIEFVELSQTSITTNLYRSASGASQLLGIGLKSSITGKHAPIVITDDICNVTDRLSKAERERTKIQYQELQNIKNRNGRIINLGTRWHKDDVFELMPNHHVYDYHNTKLISDEQIEKIRESMTPTLFACNYELKIIASEDVLFANPKKGADIEKVQQGTCHVDCAFYGEDYTAFTICAKHDGEFYVYGRCWRKHIDDCIDEIISLRKQFNAGAIYMELNADKGMVAKEFRKRGERTSTYHEHTNKYLKITSYLYNAWKNVVFVVGTDEEYIEQILDYNENAEHDDCPDSLASLLRAIWNKAERTEDRGAGLMFL